MWMVRAGRGAAHADDFNQKKLVAVGWNLNNENLTTINNKKAITDLVKRAYPDQKDGWIYITAGQISRFCFDIKPGDRVISYNNDLRIYLVGTIDSELKYKKNIIQDYHHYRQVRWDGTVQRDVLSVPTKNSLGAISTIFSISEDARAEIENRLKGKPLDFDEDVVMQELDVLKEDIIEKSKEFIKDKILTLNWEEMQELMAGILRAMGYKTRVSPKGPDRGKDIFASPDGLGLEQPRIFVEVKHRKNTSIGAPEIRSFIGGRKPGDSCLYVSTGGFTKEAFFEAERSDKPLTLINADDLVDILIKHYEHLDNETRTLVPLTRVYWPV